MKRPILKIGGMLLAAILLLSSCARGFDDNWTFTSDVKNTQLESPDADKITISTAINSNGEEILLIKWPIITGAGGYEFTLYNADDPDNLIPVGEEKELIDGASVIRSKQEDTKYKVSVRTLGNPQLGNTEAKTATTVDYSTLLKAVVIPDGSDLYEYFNENPIASSEEELGYELVAGGNYTISDVIDFGTNQITLRGDKVNHANVVMGENGRISTTAGLKIKFIDFDCNAIPGSSSNAALLLFSSKPDESIKGTGDYYIISDPVVIQSCNIKDVNGYLVYDNNKKYCPNNFHIRDCVVNLSSNNPAIYMRSGYINNMNITSNTFANSSASQKYFIQFNNSGRPDRSGLINATLKYTNNTFYNIAYEGQFYNGSGMNYKDVKIIVKQNLFLDCGGGSVARYISANGNNTTKTKEFGYNSYWYNGEFPENEKTHNYGDKSGTHIESDPKLKDPANGDFTVSGSEQIGKRVGDPRWLPEVQEEE